MSANHMNDMSLDCTTSVTTEVTSQGISNLTAALTEIAELAFSAVSEEDFIAAYSRIFEAFVLKGGAVAQLRGSSSEALSIRRKLLDLFMQSVSASIRDMIMEENLEETFRYVENLKLKDAQSNKINSSKWRPPGDVEKHMAPFELASTMEEKAALERALLKDRTSLQILKTRLNAIRQKVRDLETECNTRLIEMEKKIAKNVTDNV